MTNPMTRLASLATTACLALAIIVGVIDSAQLAATVPGTPAVAVAAFASITPAVGTLA
jgi:2-keto-4-pentenoate hydratase